MKKQKQTKNNKTPLVKNGVLFCSDKSCQNDNAMLIQISKEMWKCGHCYFEYLIKTQIK